MQTIKPKSQFLRRPGYGGLSVACKPVSLNAFQRQGNASRRDAETLSFLNPKNRDHFVQNENQEERLVTISKKSGAIPVWCGGVAGHNLNHEKIDLQECILESQFSLGSTLKSPFEFAPVLNAISPSVKSVLFAPPPPSEPKLLPLPAKISFSVPEPFVVKTVFALPLTLSLFWRLIPTFRRSDRSAWTKADSPFQNLTAPLPFGLRLIDRWTNGLLGLNRSAKSCPATVQPISPLAFLWRSLSLPWRLLPAYSLILSILLIPVHFSFSQVTTLPYSTSFESSEGYTLNSLSAQTGKPWTLTSGTSTITNATAYAGGQSLLINAEARIKLTLTASLSQNKISYYDFYLKGVAGSLTELQKITTSTSSILMALVANGTQAELYVADGTGLGGITWITTGRKWPMTNNLSDGWQRLTVRVDTVNTSWDLYLNGQPAVFDLNFAKDKTALTFFDLKGGLVQSTGLDQFSASLTNPLFTDADNDGIDDTYEVANGMIVGTNDRYGDLDGDGVNNLLEFAQGTTAGSEIPYIEGFEGYLLNTLLSGVNKWSSTGTGSATVQGSTFKEGAKALKVTGNNYVLKRDFITREKQLWLDLQVKPNKMTNATAPTINSTMASGFYFDSTGKLKVYDGTSKSWQTVTQNSVDTTQWQRMTIYQDFNTQKFSAWINGVRVAENFGFANARTTFSKFQIEPGNADAFIDGLSIKLTEPTGLDNDGDTLSNALELSLGSNPNDVDTDGDGILDATEYNGGGNLLSELPFQESFETYNLNTSPVGQRKWSSTGTGTATVLSGTGLPNGSKQLKLTGANFTLQRSFSSNDKQVWSDLYLKPAKRIDAGTPTLASDAVSGFYFDSAGKLTVYDGITKKWQTVSTAVDLTQWQRLTVYQDFNTQKWAIWLAGVKVAESLGFATTKSAYTQLKIQTGGTEAYLDQIQVGLTEPLTLDNDGDGIINSQETTAGTDPNEKDSDGDGIADGTEKTAGTNPLEAIPFTEGFESYLANSNIDKQGRWAATNGATGTVVTAEKQAGNQSLKIRGTQATSSLQKNIKSSEQQVWSDLYLKPVKRDGTIAPTLATDTAVGFYFDNNGNLRIYNGTTAQWVTTPSVLPAGTNWQRMTLSQNFSTKKFSLWYNGKLIAQDYGFANPKNNFSFVRVSASTGADAYLDTLAASKVQPTGLIPWIDTDADGMSDIWETQYFGNLTTANPTADLDGDGLTNLQESIRGTAPKSETSKNRSFYVNGTTGNDSNYGLVLAANDLTGPKKTINGAVGTMISGDTSEVAAGNYSETKISPGTRNLILRPQGNVKVTP